MRRKDKEITNTSDLEVILKKAKVCHLGLIDDTSPYVIPAHYGYDDGYLYIHSAKEGKKIDLIKKNPNICFEIEIDHKIHNTGIPCNWSTSYRSIIGFGTASLLTDIDDKKKALEILIDHYSPDTIYDFSVKMIKNVAIIKIAIEKMAGKQSLD